MDEAQRFMKLKESIELLSDRKIRLEERFNNEKEKLNKLLEEISKKGYNPEKLSEIRKEKQEELQKALDNLEAMVKDTEEKLNTIEV